MAKSCVCGLIGGMGCSKTLLTTYMLLYYYTRGYKILCNYHLLGGIKYIYMNSIDDLSNLSLDEGYVIAIDEIAKTAEARRSSMNMVIELSHQVMQSRKISRVDRPTRMFFTAQLISSVEYRLRSSEICNMVWKPEVKYIDQLTGKPILSKIEIYVPDKLKIDEFKYSKTVYFPPLERFKGGVIDTSLMDVCNYYNHRERIENMGDNSTTKMILEYAEKVPEEFAKTKAVIGYLRMQPKLNNEAQSMLDTIASWVIAGRKNPNLLDELRDSLNQPTPEVKSA